MHLSFQENNTPGVNIADEPTGPHFSPDKKILFLNLQRANGAGVTIGITGPFAKRSVDETEAPWTYQRGPGGS